MELKYAPGQKVWRIHKYPVGAKVSEVEIYTVTVTFREDSEPIVTYQFKDGFKIPFKESELFSTKQEALAAKEEWCSNPEVVKNSNKLKEKIGQDGKNIAENIGCPQRIQIL